MNGFKEMFLIVTLFLCVAKVFSKDVIVKSSYGPIIGKEVASILQNKTFFSFLGVPYAKPPVEKLRFKPPELHDGWKEPLIAKKSKKHCIQFNDSEPRRMPFGVAGDEDCLYLNIHTPVIPPDNEIISLPVIVYIHSEYLKLTVNYTQEYGPDFFVNEDVLVVTINHRLGSLGFISYEDEVIPGNNGLRDLIMALQWLHINIGMFGGDNKRVTLMGSGSGAGLADILLHVPQAKGLFSRVILHSSSSWHSMYFPDKSREKATALTEVVTEIKPTTSTYLLKYMADADASKISELESYAVHADEARGIQRPITAFGIVVEPDHEDALIKKLPEESKIDIDVPIMIGYNSRESMAQIHRYLTRPQYLTFADRDFLFLFPIRTGYQFKLDDSIYFSAVTEIKDFYFDDGYVKISRPGEYMTYLNDLQVLYPIDYTVRKYVNESKSPIYYYTFDYSGDLNLRKKQILEDATVIDGTWGATTADELCYLFLCKPIRKLYKQAIEEDSEEIKVLQNMIRLWTNFAKTGNPTPYDENLVWKPATPENKECLVLNDEPYIAKKLHDSKIKFWDDFIEKYKELAVDGVVQTVFKDEL